MHCDPTQCCQISWEFVECLGKMQQISWHRPRRSLHCMWIRVFCKFSEKKLSKNYRKFFFSTNLLQFAFFACAPAAAAAAEIILMTRTSVPKKPVFLDIFARFSTGARKKKTKQHKNSRKKKTKEWPMNDLKIVFAVCLSGPKLRHMQSLQWKLQNTMRVCVAARVMKL